MGRRKKNHLEKPFYALTEKMMTSAAWRQLSVYAHDAFIHLAIKFKGSNARDISLTYREINWLMSEHRFKKSIDELVQFGFIDIIRSGGVWKQCNIYGLSERWRLWGTDKFIPGKRFVINPDYHQLFITEN